MAASMQRLMKHTDLVAAGAVVLVVVMMIIPLPPAIIDLAITLNISVALRYDAEKLAPEVLAKGKDLVAAQIRKIAKENEVPVISDPPLARSLHGAVEIGQQIPEELYQAVAQLLAFVYRVANRKVAS